MITSGTVVLTTSVPASTRVIEQTGTGAAAPGQTAGAALGLGVMGIAMGML